MTTVKVDPTEIDFFTDPETARKAEPYFDHMLANQPVWREPKYGVVIVTGYEEALQVYHQPEVYSSINRTGGPVLDLPVELTGNDLTEVLEKYREYFPNNDQIVTFDPPVHTDHRSLLMGLITPKRLRENEEFLKRTADRFLDGIIGKGECEFIWDYAKSYTVLAVADLLGVPEGDQPMLLELLASSPGPVLGNLELQANHHNTIEKLYEYFVGMIEKRRAEPREDVITGMALATFPDGTLPEPLEVARIAANMFSAGQETTVQLMGIALQRIADDQQLQNLLRGDTSLIPKFIEETLRIEAPIKGSFRLTKVPTSIGGLDLSPGTVVMLLHGAAGRDPRLFDNPAEFDVLRANARQHLAFGRGIHTCPGAPLARAEAVFSIQRFLDRTEQIGISEEHHGPEDAREWDLIRSYKFRGHNKLYLEYTAKEAS
ncbi:cytochrome P450 [Arthrobacter sunyaminii]|uniref:Cytochrome P450 n=1 Tax=Arthrobacter sunyaminii TaxID=2816859 RepID=A0A975XKY0_9MICC|nr:cytochrome P450 [Arthrobacter sunyaminii]MBO0909816.1 cytochrome P450 [Arthrobacter sunyaminii]QWQ36606.1 cytochrome P450 [Arthrobacter sunyaminii]